MWTGKTEVVGNEGFKKKILASSPLLPQRQGYCPHSVGGITGRHHAHCSSVTSTPGPSVSLNFWGPFFYFYFYYSLFIHLSCSCTFPFFWIMNKKCRVNHVCPPPPRNLYISIYFSHKRLFSPNPMIIITGSFRNTSNYMK